MAKVFSFDIWFKNTDGTTDYDYTQTRLVVAHSAEEAEEKLNAYREEQIKNGFCDFVYMDPLVEIDEVII